MTEKAHNVTSLNDPAPEQPAATEETPGRFRRLMNKVSPRAKTLAIGIGTGAALTLAAVKLSQVEADEEPTEETPEV